MTRTEKTSEKIQRYHKFLAVLYSHFCYQTPDGKPTKEIATSEIRELAKTHKVHSMVLTQLRSGGIISSVGNLHNRRYRWATNVPPSIDMASELEKRVVILLRKYTDNRKVSKKGVVASGNGKAKPVSVVNSDLIKRYESFLQELFSSLHNKGSVIGVGRPKKINFNLLKSLKNKYRLSNITMLAVVESGILNQIGKGRGVRYSWGSTEAPSVKMASMLRNAVNKIVSGYSKKRYKKIKARSGSKKVTTSSDSKIKNVAKKSGSSHKEGGEIVSIEVPIPYEGDNRKANNEYDIDDFLKDLAQRMKKMRDHGEEFEQLKKDFTTYKKEFNAVSDRFQNDVTEATKEKVNDVYERLRDEIQRIDTFLINESRDVVTIKSAILKDVQKSIDVVMRDADKKYALKLRQNPHSTPDVIPEPEFAPATSKEYVTVSLLWGLFKYVKYQ